MTEREKKIIRLAEGVMGWRRNPSIGKPLVFHYWLSSRVGSGICYLNADTWAVEWNPFTSIADAYEMEASIPEEKRDAYVQELLYGAANKNEKECPWCSAPAECTGYWKIIHATPAQRSEAALAVLEAQRGRE